MASGFPEAAQKIINERKQVTGLGKDPQVVGPETGVSQDPPSAEPTAPPKPESAPAPATPAAEAKPEPKGESQRVPLSRLKEVITGRNDAVAKSDTLESDNATLREEIAELQRKQKVQALKDGEGRPSGFEDLPIADQILWLQEQQTPEKSTPPEPVMDDRMIGYLNERDLQLKGYSLEEAVILNEIITSNPNLDEGQVMTLAEAKAPDLFAGLEGEEESGSLPAAHTTRPPRSTRTTKVEPPDPRADNRKRGREAETFRERQNVGLDIIRHARANPQIINEKGEVVNG